MRIILKKSFEIFPDQWHVTQFVTQHNHGLLLCDQVCFLPSYRSISKEDEQKILLYKEVGLSIRQTMRVMELEKNLNHGDLPFLQKDIYNFFQKMRKTLGDNDVVDLLEYCKLAKNEDPRFQYEYTIDEHNRLEHFFWSPSRCFNWYQKYGDVVAFDTTYKVNYYDMPFGIFVGIDNHGRAILFGSALLRNENVATFRWLMKTFIALMKKSPKTIITDQDPWMTRAIEIEMPLVKHAFCIWHITNKFSGWFTSILRDKYMAWCAEFYRLYKVDNIEDFEFNLQENKHIMGLYEIRKFWAPCYLRGYFFGGMRTTGRSESINSFVKCFTSYRLCLTQLIKQVNLAIEDIGQKQSHNVMLDTYRGSSLRTLSPLKKQVYGVFTNFAFKKFQGEFEMATQYKACAESEGVFIVQHYDYPHSQKHKVLWDGIMAECSCRNFEFWGIICCHVLTIFLHKDCFQIPLAYLSLRWYRDEYHEIGSSSLLGGTMSKIEILPASVEDTIKCPPSSIPKGRHKNKRDKSSKELASKQVKTCRFCKKTGHNITTCQEKENSDANVISSNVGKKRKTTQENRNLNPVYSLKF